MDNHCPTRCDGDCLRKYFSTSPRAAKPLKKRSGATPTSRRPFLKFGSSARSSSANIGEVPSSASWIGRLPESFCQTDRKSTRLNSSHPSTSYAVSCLKLKRSRSSIFLSSVPRPPTPTLFPYTTLFRSAAEEKIRCHADQQAAIFEIRVVGQVLQREHRRGAFQRELDRTLA